ncbi:MAG: hypothetical protein KIT87_18285 [Anaerolineae bacterium]|nr:hypothetical protein [Anaerolineae bacterium]
MSRKVLIGVSVIVALVVALTVGVVAHAQTPTPQGKDASFWSFLAKRLNSTPEAIQQAMRDAAKDVVAQAVTNGKLTQDQAAQANGRIDRWQGQAPFGFLTGRPAPAGLNKARAFLSKAGLEAAAQALGMTPQDLKAELDKGQTLRQVAQAKNVDPAKVEKAVADALKAEVDKAVTAGKLTQARADQAKMRIDQTASKLMDAPLGAARPARPGPMGRPLLMPGVSEAYQAAAQTLGMTPQDLKAELGKGQTLRQVAQAKKVDPATIQQAMVAALNTRIDQAVTNGKLTQDQAAKAKDRVAQMAQKLMDAQPGQHPKQVPPTQGKTL